MAVTTRTQIPLEVDAVYNKELLFRATHLLVHDKWAKKSSLKGNSGSNLMRFRRYTTLTSSTTPLTEGTTPADTQIAQTNFTVTLNQYGAYATITDRISYESVDPVLLETVGIMGDQMGQSLDDITRDVIHAGTQVQYTGGRVSRVTVATGDNIAYTDIEKAVETLKTGIARKITPMVNATQNIGTSAINASFIAIVTPNIGKQLKRLTQFIRVENYSSTMTVMDWEIGKIDDIRVIETTNGKVFTGAGAAGIDVHSMVIFGKEAYANVAIDTEMGRSIIKDFGSAGTADPLEQRATVGWKATFASAILNNNFIVRIECAKAP
jgi:N4-gp56 family major capsid protein